MTVKMGGPMPPNPMMPPPVPLPPPMPVPPMGQQMMPMQQGTAPVAPIMRSNAGRRKRFGDSLEGMLASRRPPMAASDQMAGMNVFTGQMPRRQMMGGTAMQPPVRRMMGGGPVPRRTDIYGQDHMLAYIRPDEAELLMGLGGAGTPGPGGIPQFGLFDFFSDVFGGKSSNTGGRNEPRGSSSSSSQSYTSPSNDPYAEDRPSTSQSSADAGKQYAESMIAGGGGTNLSGSGSTAMEKLLADQKAQTQKDDGPPPDVTGSFSSPPGLPSANSGMDYINQQFYKQQEEQRKNDEIRAAREAEAKAVREAEAAAEAAALAAQEASFNQPSTQDDASNIDIFTTGDVVPIGDPSDASNIDILNTGTPIVGDPDDADNILNLDPPVEQIYYDMFGNPYKTQAEAAAADAEHLRKQQAAADAEAAAEAERLRMEQLAQLEADAAAAEAERIRIAQQAAAEAEMGLGPFGGTGGPDDPLYVSDVFETPPPDLTDPRGDEANVMTNYLTDSIADPINTGLGDKSLDKKVTDATEEDDRNFIQKLIDDIKDVPGNIANDIQMALAAGLFGSRETRFNNLIKAGYTADQANKFLDASEKTMKDMMDKQKRESAQDDDDGPTSVVDPCPEGFKLDPASGICVPDTGTDTGGDDTEEDSGDDKKDTSDDELSGVVVTPPPPTSYLDNPIRMNRGGSVGLNRAADNFLAAMGA